MVRRRLADVPPAGSLSATAGRDTSEGRPVATVVLPMAARRASVVVAYAGVRPTAWVSAYQIVAAPARRTPRVGRGRFTSAGAPPRKGGSATTRPLALT